MEQHTGKFKKAIKKIEEEIISVKKSLEKAVETKSYEQAHGYKKFGEGMQRALNLLSVVVSRHNDENKNKKTPIIKILI